MADVYPRLYRGFSYEDKIPGGVSADAVFEEIDTGRFYHWNPTTQKWVPVAGKDDQLSVLTALQAQTNRLLTQLILGLQMTYETEFPEPDEVASDV